MRPNICVTDIFKCTTERSAWVVIETVLSDNWAFYYDTLSLVTAKVTHAWKRENNCEKSAGLQQLDQTRVQYTKVVLWVTDPNSCRSICL